MHVAVDALGVKHSGGAIVLLDFLHAAICDERVSRITVFCSPRSKRNFALPESPIIREHEQPRAESSYLHRIVWFQRLLGKQCQQIDADALLCMVGAGTTGKSCPHVTFIQQSLPFFSEYRRTLAPKDRLRLTIIERLMHSSCRSASRVIVQTPTMKVRLSQRFSISSDLINILLPTVQPLPDGLNSTNRKILSTNTKAKFLFVGNDAPYKNIRTVIVGMQQLRGICPDATLYLTWPSDHDASREVGVICVGHLSRDVLGDAYREATALVMPSLVETVGLPMLEAMSLGLPVLAADRPYAHDVCENAALFFDPLSSTDFVRAALTMLTDDALRNTLVERGIALTMRREQEKPYARMVDIVLAAAG